MNYLFFVSATLSVLFFLLLLAKSNKRTDHYFLASIFLLITINSMYVFFFYKSTTFYFEPFFSELNYAIPLLYAPLLWFYARSVTDVNFKLRPAHLWHLAPFICFLGILLTPYLTGQPLLESEHVGYPLIKLIITPFYLLAILIMLRNYQTQLREHFSYKHEMNHMWLSWITVGAIALWIIAVLGYVSNIFSEVNKTLLYDYYVLSFLAVFLFWLAFLAFNKTDILTNNRKAEQYQEIKNTIQTKMSQDVNEAEMLSDYATLEKVMSEQQPFLNPVLSISKLSQISGIPQYRISRLLNSHLNRSFYDYINGYRVDMVKAKLQNGEADKYSILGISMDCGFNSKASFNRIFKKLTGTTPTQYLSSVSEKK